MANLRFIIITFLVVIAVQAAALFALGHSFMCPCGYFSIWDGAARSQYNSQQLFDWYSFSHIVYGIAGYFLFLPLQKKFGWPVAILFLMVMLCSLGWELFENTAYVTHRFRQETISFNYYGDSIINSLSDTLCVALGFWLAFSFPVWGVVALAVGFEALTTVRIHDGLILNTIMFIHPFKSILAWQAALTN